MEARMDIVREGNLLFDTVSRTVSKLLPLVREDFSKVQQWFPRLREIDLLHGLEYDPEVPLRDEINILRPCPLTAQYRSLTNSLTRTALHDAALDSGSDSLLPQLVGELWRPST